jgi:polygalacturonase
MCKDASVEGVIILDPAGWTLNTFGCENVTIENVKIISARPNGDGITTQSCKNLTARNCFVRSWDDSLVVKNYGNGVSENILFKDIVIWSDLAQSCEIGYETLGPRMDGITFEDITVLHNFHKPVMSIHNSDQAHIQNVTFRDITVEDAQMGLGDATNDNFLIDLSIAESQWSRSEERGNISNVLFENITVLGGLHTPSRIRGFDESHAIDGVTIRNLNILGNRIDSLEAGKIRVEGAVKDVRID